MLKPLWNKVIYRFALFVEQRVVLVKRLLPSQLLAFITWTVRVGALSAVLTDVASTLGVLAGLLRIRTRARHFVFMRLVSVGVTSCQLGIVFVSIDKCFASFNENEERSVC